MEVLIEGGIIKSREELDKQPQTRFLNPIEKQALRTKIFDAQQAAQTVGIAVEENAFIDKELFIKGKGPQDSWDRDDNDMLKARSTAKTALLEYKRKNHDMLPTQFLDYAKTLTQRGLETVELKRTPLFKEYKSLYNAENGDWKKVKKQLLAVEGATSEEVQAQVDDMKKHEGLY